ncbi:uncharacterized protein L203_103133 [Cryptococcus depauperatus CBS 7841]|uniref:Uncharacterized protein n=1 Tax=Cryptococcus depauperatus CBS 7841 TaxID=1295531 RepID=A0A1E3IPF7_9TREE|nr:hypothetical protein L203_01593 [Cryptococcus depauperatus CBS 7841]
MSSMPTDVTQDPEKQSSSKHEKNWPQRYLHLTWAQLGGLVIFAIGTILLGISQANAEGLPAFGPVKAEKCRYAGAACVGASLLIAAALILQHYLRSRKGGCNCCYSG